MSFWKFMAAPSTTDSISSILQAIPSTPASSNNLTNGGGDGDASVATAAGSHGPDATQLTPAEVKLYETTLDSLLAAPDLLSEIKSGSNEKLERFLSSKPVVLRLGGWVVWGLGRPRLEGVPNGGILSDDIEDGKVPDFVVSPPSQPSSELGMGGVTRRRDMDEMGVLEGGEPETSQEKAWAAFPRLCTEILTSESPNLGAVLFDHFTGPQEPSLRTRPEDFLLPFWESLLGSTETQLETRAVQVGYWARVNGTLLNGPRGQEALACIVTIPHLLSRLLALLPFCSPINDLLLLILRISTPPSPLIPNVVTQTVRMLDPFSALGKAGHSAADELLRGMIELCSAAPSQGPGGQESTLDWRDNTLARQIADGRTVLHMIDWMLQGVNERQVRPVGEHDDEATPRIATVGLDEAHDRGVRAGLRTSSLVQSISVLVDLIRKNNSDFVEQQMLSWARRKEEEATEREILEADGAELVGAQGGGESDEDDRGPSLVDLSAMLSIVATRLSGFQDLIRSPRSLHGPIGTSVGVVTPLTLERFRICEFYAELLHCSNMSLVNRPSTAQYLYDSEGYLARGWKAADDLAEALAGPPHEEEDDARDIRLPASPTFEPVSRSSDPIDLQVASTRSGLSTPSQQGSLDSESGILTRAEARELRDLVAAAASAAPSDDGSVGDDVDPFGDPDDAIVSDEDLAAATTALQLDDELRAVRRRTDSPSREPHDLESSFVSPKSMAPGPLLKSSFMEHRVIETILQMFFDFPWNNFLHNVVFDILQQIFHGRIDRPLDRQLALSVFLEGRLIDRILEGQAANDEAAAKQHGSRMGYMGHMILIAEEVVKLFDRYPDDIYAVVQPHIPDVRWNTYVETTLRETRERDLVQLGGGVTVAPHDTASTASGISDEDDEFPMNSQRALRAMETGGQAGGGSPTVEGAFGGHGSASIDLGETSPGDQFSRYLQNAISSDRPDKFGSSDDDDDDDDDDVWGGEPEGDFALASSIRAKSSAQTFGFDDRFDSMGSEHFRNSVADAEDDGEWGAFASEQSGSGDDFKPTVATSSFGFTSNFGTSTDAPGPEISVAGTSSNGQENTDDDDFGDFEDAPSITLPSMDALEDFDFGEENRRRGEEGSGDTGSMDAPRPSFARTVTADHDGSAHFGAMATSFETSPAPAPSLPLPVSHDASSHATASDFPLSSVLTSGAPLDRAQSTPTTRARSTSRSSNTSGTSLSPPSSPSLLQADLATSKSEPLGPAMNPTSHLTEDGFIEAVSEVDGSIIRVPADDIVLAHRRSSSEGERPMGL